MSDELASGPASSDGTEIRVTLARFEAKLDVALAQHSAKLDMHEREITTLRVERKEIVAEIRGVLEGHGSRILSIERASTVTAKGLVGAIASTVLILGGTITFLDRLYS